MLGFLKPRGELVELSGRQVVFLTEKKYNRDATLEVRLSLPAPSDKKIDIAVRILSQRPGPNQKQVTVAVVETPMDYPSLQGRPLRTNRRETLRLTLKSGDLPGFRAVTQDLSLGGFKTELEGELVVGDQFEVALEFDHLPGFSLPLLARVCWVENRGGGRFVTGFSFPEQGRYGENFKWLNDWFVNRGDTEVKTLFKKNAKTTPPPSLPKIEEAEVPAEGGLDKNLNIRIPFKGFLRGWAWEQGEDVVVIVLEDDEGNDHWLEFPGCRGMHARCRDRKIRLQGVTLVANSGLIEEYSRTVTMESLYHFSFLDDYARVCLDLVAAGCRRQKRARTSIPIK